MMSDEREGLELSEDRMAEVCRSPFEVEGIRERDLLVMRRLARTDLRGRYFYSFSEQGVVQWQGRVLAQEGDTLRVELGEWFGGESNGERVVPVSSAVNWLFYEDHKAFLADIRWLGEEECRLGEAQGRRRARLSDDRNEEVQ